jgi:hypothetical protein
MAQQTLKDDLQEKLTKREYFAALAMQGLLTNTNLKYHFERIANDSVDISDALIKALNK